MKKTLRLQDKLLIIDQLSVFNDLSAREKLLVAANSVLVEYKKGDLIYAQGSAASAFYCVVTGRVKISVEWPLGREDVIDYLKRGKYFGIISLLTNEKHSVSARALNDSIVLVVPKESFDGMISRIPRLALYLSQVLSRRFRRPEVFGKRIFESMIVSVCGTTGGIGVTNYAINLAVSLKAETKKEVIFVEIGRPRENRAKSIGLKCQITPITLKSPFFKAEDISSHIEEHDLGPDIINIIHLPDDAQDAAYLIPLVTYLTTDYHYVIIDLPPHLDRTSFDVMKQSDFVHLLVPSNRKDLESASKLVAELDRYFAGSSDKIKVITMERSKTPVLPFSERTAVLKHDIFATLPDLAADGLAAEVDGPRLVAMYPRAEYSRAVRRIARQMGEVLIGLALGCGAALGFAHVGVLKVLRNEGIPIDIVAGTSMGALVGALWASGKSIEEIEESVSRYKTRLDNLKLLDFTFPRRGIIKGGVIRNFLAKEFGKKTFYDLKLPFKAIACDIETRQEVVLESGPLVDAVMASISIPGVFEPVRLNGRILVDGGIINPLPTNVLARMGVNKMIAVNTLPSPDDVIRSKKKVANIFDIIVNGVQASEYLLAEIACQSADVALHPIVPTMDWFEFFEGRKAIARGEEEAKKFLPDIKELISQ
jgi:predicted acylesterase/phospholipase RssA